jgi:hypothetical protein
MRFLSLFRRHKPFASPTRRRRAGSLRLETLENRALLVGGIQGQVFNDADQSGAYNDGELGQPGWTLYIDGNNNGLRDPGEMTTATTANGQYTLANVAAGRHLVRLAPRYEQSTTAPLLAVLPVDVANSMVTGKDFGVVSSDATPLPDFALSDVNPATNPGRPVSPRDYLGQVSAWYFIHST